MARVPLSIEPAHPILTNCITSPQASNFVYWYSVYVFMICIFLFSLIEPTRYPSDYTYLESSYVLYKVYSPLNGKNPRLQTSKTSVLVQLVKFGP